ncbi:2-succinylbenzoyl-CoA synthetase [Ferrimonas sediminum]|uniref:2-succinylbenzoyl-CoA synthetase n=1 Tax=Ferrimonas sediminum TaxID=718193 RepID=A0A1G8XE36_9GAMM|nr:o-succinylbenzoate--CoA ligase [Ferrimonas sediminum]SDJ88614.1 2-succinylbenzoyl-CoA synthetase [Ferrimonas sediminum]
MALVPCLAAEGAARFPDRVAIDHAGTAISYRELHQRVTDLTTSLKSQGVGHGTHLAAIDNTSLTLILLQLSCIRLGAVFAPISPRFPEQQRQQLLLQIDASVIWTAQGKYPGGLPALTLPNTAPAATIDSTPLSDDQAAVSLILTSGSSGFPKAAMHSLANHLASASGSARCIPLQAGDRWLASLPMFHIGGLAILFRCLGAGATLVLPRQRDLLDTLREQPVTHLSLVATQLARILGADDSSSLMDGLKVLLLGGGPMPASLLSQLDTHPVQAFTSYGLTEMASQVTTGPANACGLSGQLLPQRQLRIRQGIVEVRGATRFMGYYQQGQLQTPFDDDGWFHTKDRGRWTQGQLEILGRADNMFISGGENVQPEEIEAALKQHPQIQDALVFPEANPEFGYLPVAVLHCRETLPAPSDLDQFLAPRLARFKRPRRYLNWPSGLSQYGLKVSRLSVARACGLLGPDQDS